MQEKQSLLEEANGLNAQKTKEIQALHNQISEKASEVIRVQEQVAEKNQEIIEL